MNKGDSYEQYRPYIYTIIKLIKFEGLNLENRLRFKSAMYCHDTRS